jgi:hypothetical protein
MLDYAERSFEDIESGMSGIGVATAGSLLQQLQRHRVRPQVLAWTLARSCWSWVVVSETDSVIAAIFGGTLWIACWICFALSPMFWTLLTSRFITFVLS